MAQYTIKPPIYNAAHWDGTNDETIIDFVGINIDGNSRFRAATDTDPAAIYYDGQGGFWEIIVPGNWVVLDTYGNYQPWDADQFDATFEPV